MIRKCSDCQRTPPSLHHQDLKPRVNRANCDMGVCSAETQSLGLAVVAGKMMAIKRSLMVVGHTRIHKEL